MMESGDIPSRPAARSPVSRLSAGEAGAPPTIGSGRHVDLDAACCGTQARQRGRPIRRDRTSRVAGGDNHGCTGWRQMRLRCTAPRPRSPAHWSWPKQLSLRPHQAERPGRACVQPDPACRSPWARWQAAEGLSTNGPELKHDAPAPDLTATSKSRDETIRLKIDPRTAHALTRGL